MSLASRPWQSLLTGAAERLSFLSDSSQMTDLTIAFPGQERTLKVSIV